MDMGKGATTEAEILKKVLRFKPKSSLNVNTNHYDVSGSGDDNNQNI